MIVLDVESSGVDWNANSILSLGAIDLENPTNQFYDECRVWDGAKIAQEALDINGFTEEEALSTDRKTEAELITAFVAWAMDKPQNRTLCAQNVSFDYEFVRSACRRAGIDFPFAKRTIDIHTLAWGHMSARGVTPPVAKHHSALASRDVLAYCGLPEEAQPHNALSGALWHAEVISRIAYNKKTVPDFEMYDIPWMKK